MVHYFMLSLLHASAGLSVGFCSIRRYLLSCRDLLLFSNVIPEAGIAKIISINIV